MVVNINDAGTSGNHSNKLLLKKNHWCQVAGGSVVAN